MEQAAPDLAVRLFGNLEILVRGSALGKTRTKKERALFALFAVRNGAPTDRDWFARNLWPESLPEQARSNLRRSLCDLNRTLGSAGDRTLTRSGELGFDFSGVSIDAVEFDEAATRRNLDSLRRAVQLHRAPLLATFDDEWARHERARRLDTFLSVAEVLASWTEPQEAAAALESALRQDPTNEHVARRLIEVLSDSGSVAAALQTYHDWAERLSKEFGSTPSPETAELVGQLRSKPRLRPQAISPVRLPDYSTTFFGREDEIVQLTMALRECSGVLLSGLPGIGKTRLAVELARGVSREFSDGVVFVEAGRASYSSLIESCAMALDMTVAPTAEALAVFLRRRNVLVVVDDVDQDFEKIEVFVATLTGGLSKCRFILTSRRPMNLPAVRLFHISPLGAGPSSTGKHSPAASMFENRARLVNAGFAMTEANSASVEAICGKLDGIPLAIEIAAAWIESLPLSTIDGNLGVRLARSTAAVDSHGVQHKTLSAAFEECLGRLSANELGLLQCLAPFEDGWTLLAAGAVCGMPETDVAVALGGVVHKSLVTPHLGGERYRMLDTTREILLAGLSEEERDATIRQFAEYYRDFLLDLDATPDKYFEDMPDDRLMHERRNLEIALGWWQLTDPDLGLRLQFLLFHWRILGTEGMEWVDRLLAGDMVAADLEPMAFTCAGLSAFWARRRGAFDLLSKAVTSAVASNQPQWEAHAFNGLSLHYQRLGQFREAADCEKSGELAARRANMPFFAALSLASRSFLEFRQGNAGALEDLRMQLHRAEYTGNWRGRYAALRALCGINLEIGDLEEAGMLATSLTALAREHCRHELANILLWCAEIERKRGNYDAARHHLSEVIEVSRERRGLDQEAAALQEFSLLAESAGHLDEAESYLVQACRIFESRNAPRPLVDLLLRRSELAMVAQSPWKARNLLEVALDLSETEGLEWRDTDDARISALRQSLVDQVTPMSPTRSGVGRGNTQ